MNRGTLPFVSHFFRAYPARSAVMVVFLSLGGLAEGIGVATMLPFLNVAMGSTPDGGTTDRLTEAVTGFLAWLGIAPTLFSLLGLIVVGIWLKSAFMWLGMTQVGYIIAEVTADLRLRLMRALLQARWSYFVKQQVGHFANALASESQRAAFAYREACTAAAALVQISMYLTVAFLISWPVALAAIVAGVALVRALGRFVHMTRHSGEEQTSLMNSLTARLTDVVLGIKALKAMGMEERVTPFLEDRTQGLKHAQRRQVLAIESMQLFQEPVVVVLLSVGLLGAVTMEVASFPEILVLAIVFYRLLRHFNTLQLRAQAVAEGESAFWALWDKITASEAAAEAWPGRLPAPSVSSGLEFDGVWFAYEDEPVLKGIDLRIPSGSFVSIVGESGSGKTTMADLAAGLLVPTRGRIAVDGVDLSDVDLASWRQVLGYVPQELLLFHGSVRENVSLGDVTLDEPAIWRALEQAGARQFVESLPEGLDTPLGERGARLSGGQRQRIAIARALVRNPRILILDEVTAALDPETEMQFAEVLRGLAGSMTMISISHRPVLSAAADMVVHIGDGKVAALEQRAGESGASPSATTAG